MTSVNDERLILFMAAGNFYISKKGANKKEPVDTVSF
jgi:hypothetical protein